MHILPTRGRPELLQRYFDEGKPSMPGVVVIDHDQDVMYSKMRLPEGWNLIYVPPMMGFVWKVNMAFKLFPNEDWYSFTGDDMVGRTPNWDVTLSNTARRGHITWGNDLINGKCTHPFIYGDFCRDLGWVAHPEFKHLYVDTIWEEIARRVGIGVPRMDIVTEAHHFCNGKLLFDQTARERMEMGDSTVWDTLNRNPKFWPQMCAKVAYRFESLNR
jgi:hypothetical protein